MRWRLNPGFNEVCLVRSPGAPPADGRLIAADVAATRVDEWFRRDDTRELGDVCRALDGAAMRDRPEGQRRRIRHALTDGRLRAYRLPNDLAGQYLPPPKDEELPVREAATRDWIEIALVDESGNPVANAPFVLTLPDGTKRWGQTNGAGFARYDGIEPGACDLSFTEIDEHAWRPA